MQNSDPKGARNQIEGGILQGTSRALGEEITWIIVEFTSTDWNSYKTLALGIQLVVGCVLLDRQRRATGAGETAKPLNLAAAIGNAISDATGARIRQVPFTPERVEQSLIHQGMIRDIRPQSFGGYRSLYNEYCFEQTK